MSTAAHVIIYHIPKIMQALFSTFSYNFFLIHIQFSLIHQADEDIRQMRIKLASLTSYEFASHLLHLKPGAVDTIGCHRIITVTETDHSCNKWYLLSCKPIRVSLSVVSLMMMPNSIKKAIHTVFRVPSSSYPITACCFISANSSSFSFPGLFRIASGMPTLPISCTRPI